MAQASLMTRSDSWFVFEHAMAHRALLGPIGPQPGITPPAGATWPAVPPVPPLSRFSAVPYFVDPEQDVARAANMWHLNHQQAHTDFLKNIPSQYAFAPNSTPTAPPTPITYGLRIGQDLVDNSLADERQMLWWTFFNHQEHRLAATVTAPAPAPKPAPQATFPFW